MHLNKEKCYLVLFGFLIVQIIIFINSSAIAQSTAGGNSSRSFNSETTDGIFPKQIIDAFSLGLTDAMVPTGGLAYLETYVLGPGDRVSIQIDGPYSFTLRGTMINSEGVVLLPNIGKVSLVGLSLKDANALIDTKISSLFNDASAQITLEIPRPVKVQVVGLEATPITISLPPFSTIVDLMSNVFSNDTQVAEDLKTPQNQVVQNLFSGGNTIQNPFDEQQNSVQLKKAVGIQKQMDLDSDLNSYFSLPSSQSRRYSIRNIEIQSGETIKHIDIANSLINGAFNADQLLQDGDIVRLVSLDNSFNRISVSGAVNRSFEIDYKEEDSIESLLQLAGGLAISAKQNELNILRTTASEIQQIILNEEQYEDFNLQANDRIIVPKIDYSNTINASVWVKGEVNNPGNYPIIPGKTTVADIIKLVGGTTNSALLNGAYIIHDLERLQGNELLYEMLLKRTSDQIVEGLNYMDYERGLSNNYVHVNLENAGSFQLTDGDQLVIPKNKQQVEVFGQVNKPGNYAFDSGKDWSTYISDAGSYALAADIGRVFVIKAGSMQWQAVGTTEIESGDKIFVDRIPLTSQANELQLKLIDVQKEQVKNQRFSAYVQIFASLAATIPTIILISRR
jgi:protein involved in polysaccharide export with SLBB domain